MSDIQVGQEVKLRAKARDTETGELVFPTVTAVVRAPSGSNLLLDFERVDDEFLSAFTVTEPGAWVATVSGEGEHKTRGQITVHVAQPK